MLSGVMEINRDPYRSGIGIIASRLTVLLPQAVPHDAQSEYLSDALLVMWIGHKRISCILVVSDCSTM